MLKLCYWSVCILHCVKEARQYHNKSFSSHQKLQDFPFPLLPWWRYNDILKSQMSNQIWLFPACASISTCPCWSMSGTICIFKKRNVLKYFPRFRTKSSSAVSPEQNPATPVWQLNNSPSVTRHTGLSGMCSHIPKIWTHLSSTISNLSFFFKPAIWFLSGPKRGKEGDTTTKDFLPLWNARAKAWLKLAEN